MQDFDELMALRLTEMGGQITTDKGRQQEPFETSLEPISCEFPLDDKRVRVSAMTDRYGTYFTRIDQLAVDSDEYHDDDAYKHGPNKKWVRGNTRATITSHKKDGGVLLLSVKARATITGLSASLSKPQGTEQPHDKEQIKEALWNLTLNKEDNHDRDTRHDDNKRPSPRNDLGL